MSFLPSVSLLCFRFGAPECPPRAVNRPVVGLGTGVDFSLLASACRGHLVGVCLHGVGVHTVALAVVVVVRRLFIFFRPGLCLQPSTGQHGARALRKRAPLDR